MPRYVQVPTRVVRSANAREIDRTTSMDNPTPEPEARAGVQLHASEAPFAGRRRPHVTAMARPGRRWSSELRTLGCCMVGLGIVVGLCFPFFLGRMQLATPTAGW